jgi:uncharacterized protein YbjQ (UPF0145 family)
MLMTTTEAIPGYVIEQVLGLVEASTTLGVGTARNRMVRKAEQIGANAVVGARYAGGSGGGLSGTICYGTAVVARSQAG